MDSEQVEKFLQSLRKQAKDLAVHWKKYRMKQGQRVYQDTAIYRDRFKNKLSQAKAKATAYFARSKHWLLAHKRASFMTLAAVLTCGVILATGVDAGQIQETTLYAVYVDGEKIGYVENQEAVYTCLESLQTEAARALNAAEVAPKQVVELVAAEKTEAEADDDAVAALLAERLEFARYAYTIMVNNRPTLTVATLEDYEAVIESLKNAYISDDITSVQSVVLKDRVEARLTLIDNPNKIYSAEKAAEILQTGTDKRETYLVSRGDSLWTIARNHNTTVEEIRNANPHLANTDRLMPGDEINLVVAEPLVDVSVTEEKVVEERIKYETEYKNDSSLYKGQTKVLQAGEYGVKEVTYLITKNNGREVERQVLAEKILKEPRKQVVARGTKPVPAGSGTGQFLWPVAGRGRITSRYGYRNGGFHRGVDIGTPTGSAILAADSGTVVQAGWYGAYGILVTIDHGNGYVTKYAHNSKALVSVGQKVQKGQKIALSGSTGNSTGPHLHFEVIKNGSHVNPLNYL